jgi:hypothetical protein
VQVHETPGLITFHLWGVRRRDVPWALRRMALQRRRIRAVPGVRFSRLLGTGRGQTFTPTDADPLHWALLASWDTAAQGAAFETDPVITGWDARCTERWRLGLRPIRSTGRWSGQEPFGSFPAVGNARAGGMAAAAGAAPGITTATLSSAAPAVTTATAASSATQPCAILTRARLAPLKAVAFWRAVPAVAAALPAAPGLRFARGIGEAPIGLQATFSVWDDLDAAIAFAYRSPAHLRAIDRTAATGWYSEQLFARFAVIEARGAVDGRDPLGMRSVAREQCG